METVKISFVLPAWKSAFLKNAIASIVHQTYQDWELIIVDDCSPEPLRKIVSSFNDSRIQYIRNERNIGKENLVGQWNHSISFASGDYLILASDDDIYKPTFCQEIVRLAIKYPQVDLIHSSVEQIDENGVHLWNDSILPEFTNKYEYLNWWVTGRSFTCIGNFAFKRCSLIATGGFIEFPCAFGSDIATPISLSKNGVANTSEMLFCFRQSSQHLSADSSKYIQKLAGITQLSQWLRNLNYEEPDYKYWRNTYAYYFGWAKGFRVNMLNSFIVAKKGNQKISDLCDMMLFWWKNNNSIPDYFFFQILFDIYAPKDICPLVSDTLPHYLQQSINDPDFYLMPREEIIKTIPIHKLTYK